MKRIAIIADLHCGHKFGLTPPKYYTERLKHIQSEFWTFFEEEVNDLGKVDLLIVNGDAIDGKGNRSGGTELLTTDRSTQADMAQVAIECFNATRVIIFNGTPYHTGSEEDWEAVLAKRLECEYEDEAQLSIENKTFHVRHQVGGSSTPYGKASPLIKAGILEELNSIRTDCAEKGHKPPNVIIRSHVHHYQLIREVGHCYITTPCLQLTSKFGRRICGGTPDIGFISCEVSATGGINWHEHIMTSNPSIKSPIVI